MLINIYINVNYYILIYVHLEFTLIYNKIYNYNKFREIIYVYI